MNETFIQSVDEQLCKTVPLSFVSNDVLERYSRQTCRDICLCNLNYTRSNIHMIHYLFWIYVYIVCNHELFHSKFNFLIVSNICNGKSICHRIYSNVIYFRHVEIENFEHKKTLIDLTVILFIWAIKHFSDETNFSKKSEPLVFIRLEPTLVFMGQLLFKKHVYWKPIFPLTFVRVFLSIYTEEKRSE